MRDLVLSQPEMPTEPVTEVVWFDSLESGFNTDYAGVVGDLLFSEDVDVLVLVEAGPGRGLKVMNGAGMGQTAPANEPTSVHVRFTGYRTVVKFKTRTSPPAESHIAGRVTSRAENL